MDMNVNDDTPVVPNFLKLSEIPVNYEQKVSTELLDPVVFRDSGNGNKGFARFVLSNTGFLHSHSKLFVSLIPPSDVTVSTMPLGIGAMSCIDSAVMKIGNQVVNEISSVGALHQLKSALIRSENNCERELYTSGRSMNMDFKYKFGSDKASSNIGVSVGREHTEVVDYADLTDAGLTVNTELLPFADMNHNNPTHSPSYAIDLSDLFPFLKNHVLALYMFDEPISIELTLSDPSKRVVVGEGQTTDLDFLIDQNEFKFCFDSVYYGSGDEMQVFAEQNKSMSFSFVDYRNITTSVTQANLASIFVRNIGMANRHVSRVITLLTDSDLSDTALLQKYNAASPEISSGGDDDGKVGDIEYNLRYNDRFEYSSNVDNIATLFSQTIQSEGVVFVTRDGYSSEGSAITTDTYMGREQDANLQGLQSYISTRLSGGRIGSRGLEIHLKSEVAAGVDTMLNFCEYLRVMQLNDGKVSVYNV